MYRLERVQGSRTVYIVYNDAMKHLATLRWYSGHIQYEWCAPELAPHSAQGFEPAVIELDGGQS